MLPTQELEKIAAFAAVPGNLDSPRDRILRRQQPSRTPSDPALGDDPLSLDHVSTSFDVSTSLDGGRGKQALVIPPFRPRHAGGTPVDLPRAHSAAAIAAR